MNIKSSFISAFTVNLLLITQIANAYFYKVLSALRKNSRSALKNKKIITLIFGVIFLSVLNVNAQDEKIVLDSLNLRSAKSVSFYMRMNSLKEPNETEFKGASCMYKTESPDDITSLVFMLGFNDLRKSTHNYTALKDYFHDSRVWNTNFGVYFTFADGSEAKYLFPLDTGSVNGYLIYPARSFDRYPITVNHSMPWYLVYWASHLGEPMVPNKASRDLTVEQCKDEVIRTIYQRHYQPERDD